MAFDAESTSGSEFELPDTTRLLDALPEPTILASLGGDVAHVNAPARELLLPSLQRSRLSELFANPGQYEDKVRLALASRDRIPCRVEPTSAGVTYSSELWAIRDGSGSPSHLALRIRESSPTAKVAQLTRQLAERNEQLQSLFRSWTAIAEKEAGARKEPGLPEVAYWIVEANGRAGPISEKVASIFGERARALQDDPMAWIEALLPEDRPLAREEWGRSSKDAKDSALRREYRFEDSAGASRWIRMFRLPVPGRERDASGFVVLVEDVTRARLARIFVEQAQSRLEETIELRTQELKTVNARLEKEAEERRRADEGLRNALEASPISMVTVGSDGRIVMLNEAAESLFQSERGSLIGRPVERLVPKRHGAEHPKWVAEYFESPEARPLGQGRPLFALRSDGAEIPVEIRLSPFRAPEGICALASIIDLTERQRAEAQLLSKNRDLETLLYVASHDLREPLRAIQSFAKMVVDRYAEDLDAKGRDFLRRIRRAADRLDALLEDVLEISRAQRMDEPIEILSMAELVTEAMRSLGERIRESGARIRVSQDLPVLPVQRRWIERAIYNLLANAVKFAKPDEKPQIEVEAYESAKDRQAGIVVRDRGIGVEPRYAERIFGLFQRAVSRDIDGSGAGLAIVRQVAEKHSGKAWCEPREGGGSEFYLTVQVDDSSENEAS